MSIDHSNTMEAGGHPPRLTTCDPKKLSRMGPGECAKYRRQMAALSPCQDQKSERDIGTCNTSQSLPLPGEYGFGFNKRSNYVEKQALSRQRLNSIRRRFTEADSQCHRRKRTSVALQRTAQLLVIFLCSNGFVLALENVVNQSVIGGKLPVLNLAESVPQVSP